MTFRIREAQTDALAKSNVGNHVARIFAHTAKASWYDEREGCVRVAGHRDQCTRIVLGDHGNTERLVSPLGRQTAYTYQGRRQVAARLPSGLQLTTAYDSLGRVMRSMRNDGESHELAYDVHGDLKSFAAADGAAVRFSRDSNRCLRRITERDGGEVGYDYDEFGRLSAVRDPLHRIAYLHYGSGDTPERYETPDGNVIEYVYDAASAKERVNATAHAEYSSDAEGRLVSGKYADGYDWSFQYDDAGRLATARTGDTEVKYEYDQDGRLLAEDQSGNVVRYRYNEDGQLAELQLPDGRSVGYDYDLDGRVESVRDWNGCTQQFRYGTADHPLSRELPNGLIESYSLDLAGRITGIEVHDRVQAFWSQRVERDAMGRVATQHDSRMGLRRFHYDGWDACDR